MGINDNCDKLVILKKIVNYKKHKEDIKIEVKKYVQDKSIDLVDRWQVFITSELGEIFNFTESYGPFNDNHADYYDIFFIEKYETVDMVERIESGDFDEYFNNEEIDLIKESLLKKFSRGFVYNW